MTLDLCSDDDLIRALFKRYDHAVFAASTAHTTEDDKEVFLAKGSLRLCQGLCQGAISAIDRAHQSEAQTVRGDDEG